MNHSRLIVAASDSRLSILTTQCRVSGGVFCDSIDGGRAGAEIELQPVGIRARLHDGSVILIAYRQCQIEVGGFSGRMVFCRTPDRSVTIFCEARKGTRRSSRRGLVD